MKRLLVILMSLILVLSLAACGGGTPAPAEPAEPTEPAQPAEGDASDDIMIGFVVKSLADEYWKIVKKGAEDAAAELGVGLNFIAPNSESDVMGQIDMVDNLITSGISALCVAPSQPDAIINSAEEATARGIPVLFIDTDAPYDAKTTFMGTGNEAAAFLGAEWVAAQLGSGGNVVVLRGRLGDGTHDDRTNGIVNALEAGGVNILEIQPADSTLEKGMAVMEDFLQKYDNIDAVLTTADSMAQGAQRAIEQVGRNEIMVMGFDGTEPVVEMVIEGKVAGTVAQNPYQMGYMGVHAAVDVINGGTIDLRIDTGATLLTQENAAQFLDDLKALLN
ncbi:MAG: sugar ABC transporter substrate-binding protein [Bacillota bacterium]|nr:sugar ABC transporter substrate-binding protein [Bacillota bacterium]